MARILLGVTRRDRRVQGARARPPRDGRGPRGPRRPDAGEPRLRRRGVLRGASPARPVLTDELERDPARGAFPDQAPPDHDPLSHLELVANADVLVVAPASANTIAKLAAGLADNLLTTAALAATCPVLVAPAMNDRMWGTRGHARERRAAARARRRGHGARRRPRSGRSASTAPAGCPSPPRSARRPRGCLRRRPPRAPSTACGCSSPRAGRASRSTRCATSATAPRGGWGSRSRTRPRALGADVVVVAANVDLPRIGRRPLRRRSTAAELQAACEEGFGSCDVLVMAAAVVDFRPAHVHEGKMKKTGDQEDSTVAWSARRTSSPALAGRGAPGRRRRLRSRARTRARWSTVARSWHGKGWTPSWSTTWVRRASGSTPPRTR